MARKKTTTIFNKNHVTITKIEHDDNWDYHAGRITDIEHTLDYKPSNDNRTWRTKKKQEANRKKIIIRKKSPLGFYYNFETFDNLSSSNNQNYSESETLYTITFHFENEIKYVVTFYTQHNGTHVNTETHPWDIMDNKAMDDHYIDDLKTELDNLFILANEHKLIYNNEKNVLTYYRKNTYLTNNELKRELYTKLFGYPEGPKYQTNNEKILAHGFDLKTSFRK